MNEPLPIQQLPAALNALCAGQLGKQDAERLTALLESDVRARRFYIQYMDLHAALQWRVNERANELSMTEPEGEESDDNAEIMAFLIDQIRTAEADRLAREAEAALETERKRREAEQTPAYWRDQPARTKSPPTRPFVLPNWLLYAGVFAVFALVATLAVRQSSDTHDSAPGTGDPQAQSPEQSHDTAVPFALATIISGHDTVWGQGSPSLSTGSPIIEERLTLESGLATLRFGNGTEVELQGPCVIEPISSSELRLIRGKLVGRCLTPASRGFVVRTPHAEVTDLGTVFGVLVSEDNISKCFVFEGEVVVKTPLEIANLRDGEAARVDRSAVLTRRPEDASEFLPDADLSDTALGIYPYYVQSVLALAPVAYYRFDEIDNAVVINAVSQRYAANTVHAFRTSGGAENHAGVFVNNYLHVTTPIQELTGGSYTVELWARPERHAVMPMVGFYCGGKRWGGVIETGDQFRYLHRSPAGEQFEAGTSVISDIAPRRERWQHIVAVYDGENQSLYIDGVLTGTARGQAPLTPAPQLIIGGGDENTSPYSQKEAFAGMLDEVAIYDRALSPSEIKHHYRLVAGREAEERTP
ncbi:MAG: LamG-like jellyroll fold domain-containing protein [Phycisphaerales bacterium JB063]